MFNNLRTKAALKLGFRQQDPLEHFVERLARESPKSYRPGKTRAHIAPQVLLIALIGGAGIMMATPRALPGFTTAIIKTVRAAYFSEPTARVMEVFDPTEAAKIRGTIADPCAKFWEDFLISQVLEPGGKSVALENYRNCQHGRGI
jgi:hypothetical protein